MATSLNEGEIKEFLEGEPTVIFTTLGRDGRPLSLPMWYVYHDGHIYISTGGESQKVKNVRRDPRVCAVVEIGEKISELKAVVIQGKCEIVENEDEMTRVRQLFATKYAAARGQQATHSQQTTQTQSPQPSRALLKIIPDPPPAKRRARGEQAISWDNAKARR
ncbi:MAG: nitroreductase family deazaflavin-dependent oxidoreductase [Candidatus Tectomicrobia bacterium]|nr:nitroreductase family deazaflavin-dependent oxidoreductase [Candidatus Tectomicrobia bacterium]